MIEINLLPEERRKKEPAFKKIGLADLGFLKNIPVHAIAASVIAGFLAVHVILFAVGLYSKSAYGALSGEYEKILPDKKKTDLLKAEIDLIHGRAGIIDEMMKQRFSWADKLNSLSDSVVSGIWLSELSYEERVNEKAPPLSAAAGTTAKSKPDAARLSRRSILKYLVMSGYALNAGGQGTALIGKFMNGLKDNPGFYSDFRQIELVSMKSSRVEDQEVMTFKVACLFDGS